MRRLWLLFLLPTLLGADPRYQSALDMAQRDLMRGRYRVAAKAFVELTEVEDPPPGAFIGLGRAYAGLGDCPKAVTSFDGYREAGAYTARAALTEAWCWYRLGEWEQAQESARDAAIRKANLGPAWYLLALASVQSQDQAVWDEAMEGLSWQERGEAMTALAHAWRSLEHGDGGLLGIQLAELEEHAVTHPRAGLRAQIAVIDALRWMDVGDPSAAEVRIQTLAGDADGSTRVLEIRAEALRRLGHADMATSILVSEAMQTQRNSGARSVRLRTLVDLGRMDLPNDRMERLLPSNHPDDLATAWYIARARGEVELQAAIAARWRVANANPSRTLEQLIPLATAASGIAPGDPP